MTARANSIDSPFHFFQLNDPTRCCRDRHRRPGRHPRRRLHAAIASTWSRAIPGSARPRSRCSSCSKACGAASRCSTSRSRRPREELRAVAESHGWSLDGITIRELVALGAEPASPTSSTPCSTRPRSSSARPRQAILDGGRARQADARRVRLAVGAAAARRQPAALPPPDPRAQAVLRRPAAARCCCSTT